MVPGLSIAVIILVSDSTPCAYYRCEHRSMASYPLVEIKKPEEPKPDFPIFAEDPHARQPRAAVRPRPCSLGFRGVRWPTSFP